MGKFFDEIPAFLIPWMQAQYTFWVATAARSDSGHVNVSPKGYHGTFHIESPTRVWYEDLSGSGVETISHIRENGRITVLFSAFEGPPRIARLFGTGTVHEFGTPEYDCFLPMDKRLPGSRSVIIVDVHKVGTSCGFSVPFYEYKAPRALLQNLSVKMQNIDVDAELACGATAPIHPRPENGLRSFWDAHCTKSIDGIPGLRTATLSMAPFLKRSAADYGQKRFGRRRRTLVDREQMAAFMVGVLWTMVCVFVRGRVM